jgi:hypothetical protein
MRTVHGCVFMALTHPGKQLDAPMDRVAVCGRDVSAALLLPSITTWIGAGVVVVPAAHNNRIVCVCKCGCACLKGVGQSSVYRTYSLMHHTVTHAPGASGVMRLPTGTAEMASSRLDRTLDGATKCRASALGSGSSGG